MTGTPPRGHRSLPAELSSFVGRRHEHARVRRTLAESRLVTLAGPGGVGKTRLALRVAADLGAQYPDGAWVVELAAVQDPELVPDTVVAGLGLSGAAASSPSERLVEHLRDRVLLLVLDNCEHVDDAVKGLLARVLDGCPRVTVLATSRHGLALPDELVVTVPPLRVPPPGGRTGSPEALLPYDAVRLFTERATAAWPPFAITAENQADVAELVRQLDGVPLAIELAAVRVRALSAGQLLQRLSDRFALLSRGDPAGSPRQQSLSALLDWSHDLLGPQERLLWTRASVFAGSAGAADLAAVVTDEDLSPHLVPSLLDELVRKSLLVREETSSEPRFGQLQSIREYGVRRLGDGPDRQRFEDRHVAHYRDQALTAAREIYGPRGVAWYLRLRAAHDDIRAALERCASEGGAEEDGAVTVVALQHYWVMTGRFAEGRHWAGRLLDRVSSTSPSRTALLVVAGRLAVLQGDVEEGRGLLREALAHGDELSATWQAHALHALALAALFWGEPTAARSMLEEALSLHRIGDDPFGVPLALVQLATLHAALGQTRRATEYAEECIDLSARAGDQWCAAMAQWTRALAAWGEGRTADVRADAREVLVLKEPFGDRLGMAMCLEVLAWSSGADEHHEDAARLLGAVSAALDSVGGGLFRTLQDGHDRCVAATRAALGPATYDELVAEGAAVSFDDAVALALGQRPRAAGNGPVADAARGGSPARLTRRESEVAHLVAEGLSDREIAERLVLARRTAEGHVQAALRKLGLTSRHHLAGWVEAQHSPPGAVGSARAASG